MLVKMWREENPCALLVGMQLIAATVENSVEVPQKKVKNRTAYHVIPQSTLGIYVAKENKITIIFVPPCSCSVFHNSQDMEATDVHP